jgi:hypothetical protein
MVEPNSNAVFDKMKEFNDRKMGRDFMKTYIDSTYDWNALAKRITHTVREVDDKTPLIVSTMHWGNPAWLNAVVPTGDKRTIHAIHYYDPYVYSSEPEASEALCYPGAIPVEDDRPKDDVEVIDDTLHSEYVCESWLHGQFEPNDAFRRENPGIPIVSNEFGPIRWKLGADRYYKDLVQLFESRGMNYAIWVWEPKRNPPDHDDWNFQFGPNKANRRIVKNLLFDAIRDTWLRNTLFPG